MFNNNKILVVIPARGGSKRIRRKNIRLLADKPLIYYAINIAKSSQYVDNTCDNSGNEETQRLLKNLELVSLDVLPIWPETRFQLTQ